MKYAGMTNHNLEMMYLIDTKGISLVIVVKIIQTNIRYITRYWMSCDFSVVFTFVYQLDNEQKKQTCQQRLRWY